MFDDQHQDSITRKMHAASLSETQPSGSDRIEIQLRIPDQDMAKQIMDKTIALLQKTANETQDHNEKAQALQCIDLIRRDNPQLVQMGKQGIIV